MEPRSVEELMDLLYAGRCRHALRTAALLRRGRPADKELQVAGLVHGITAMPRSGGDGQPRARATAEAGHVRATAEAEHARATAEAVRALLGERVFRLLLGDGGPDADDQQRLRQAAEESRTAVFDAGVLEDWRTVLELVAARQVPPAHRPAHRN
ncbi:hypothetical protein [Streptomyces sp. NPDC005573]|uniref:hypothetical protein n=1 Tax=Streptomyces sp. NPDC005573 TaxID=3156890 RepID=UPI0033BC8E79